MLLNFRVKNYKCFKDEIEFSLEATKLKDIKKNTFTLINNENIGFNTLLKSAVIYGANASGKSSFIDALKAMKSIVLGSVNISKRYNPQPFLLNSTTKNGDTSFEIEIGIENSIYRYGFSRAVDGVVSKEWLFKRELKKGARESKLFIRENNSFSIGSKFSEGKKLIINKTREDALFLTVVAEFNGEISIKILNWFRNLTVLSNIKREDFEFLSFEKLKDEEFKEKILNLIKSADFGIFDIKNKNISFDELKEQTPNIEDLPPFILDEIKKNGVNTIETIHIEYDENGNFNKFIPFNLEKESEGTKKFLALSGPILESLKNGTILVIDELDNSLHTELVREIIKLYNSKINNKGAQLVFTTHDTNLLDQSLFRRDQIWFTQKNIKGESELYSLIEYGARNDLNLEKNYLNGKFGAVPNISSSFGEIDGQ